MSRKSALSAHIYGLWVCYVCEIDGQPIEDITDVPPREATVRYLKRPFGHINLIPADERGWLFLERFITMLKAAMISFEAFDDVVFTNSQETRLIMTPSRE